MLADTAAIATVLAVIAAVLSLRQIQRQRIRAFEDFYVARYWKLMDDLSLPVLKATTTVTLTEADERVLRAYLILCEDELELRAAGWISDRTWRIWSAAMRQQFAWAPVSQVWDQVSALAETGNGRPFRRITQFRTGAHDPVELGRAHRALRGLRGVLGE
ncbi:hypothetical protein ACIRBX_36350 [Kitasatospora sp. NPDC096147]|uniref:hypothetical protein n=1 Tax=Kitasatospora sp. NPDC096147 TaxID=3364093 RepID=UPI003830F40F